jgi:Flp pilus assembly pilin Flp
MQRLFKRIRRSDRGANFVEYATLAGFIAIAVVVAARDALPL